MTRYWKFIVRNAWADLRNRYAGTTMGIVWNVVHPLMMIAVYSLVFSAIMPTTSPGEYVLYLCSGFFPWIAFTECVTRGCTGFVSNARYLKKLPIPEQVFVAQSSMTVAMSLCVNFTLLMILTVVLGDGPTKYWLLLPIPLVTILAMGYGLGLLLGTFNVFFRDIAELTSVVLQLLMWMAPIIYKPNMLPEWAQAMTAWHPMVPALSAVRGLLLHESMPAMTTWVAMMAWPVVFITAGYVALGVLRREIRDLI